MCKECVVPREGPAGKDSDAWREGVWNGLRDIQRGRAGPQPIKPRAIRNSSGELCMGPEGSLHQWHGHFETVLNIHSNFEESVIQSAEQCTVREELALPLVEDEVMEALGKLKGNKAGGKTGILPEMLKYCGAVMMEYILDLFGTVWKEERVPNEWRDALLVLMPIPKKGDLPICGN